MRLAGLPDVTQSTQTTVVVRPEGLCFTVRQVRSHRSAYDSPEPAAYSITLPARLYSLVLVPGDWERCLRRYELYKRVE